MVHHIDRRSELMLFTKYKENCLECNSRHGRSVTSKPLFDQLEKHRAYYTPQKDPGTQGSCHSYRVYTQVRDTKGDLNFSPNKLMGAEYQRKKGAGMAS